MINSYKKPEILAPCGSYDIMIAAINAGADACYFGGNKFGARAYATNFDLETSLKAIDYAHIHGTSLYLTVNTLFKDNEITDLYDYILPYYEAGLDAVIVQDLGVFKCIKEMFPDMNIHCSTQMNITSKYAANGMKELGASRIVTAREMPLSEIAEIKRELDIEIESFVHGAMCYSYSGRCLMSSIAGGRSGNRGRCAQPCRKSYDGEYILSMKDMCTLTDVPKLIEAGIDSLKIEGRMKNEYYVASAVDAYKQISEDFLNGCYSHKKAEELKFKLANIYNRGGFCSGYYFMHNGPEMISKDRPNNQGVKLGKVTSAKDGKIGIKLYTDLFKQDIIELKLKDGSFIEITSGVDFDSEREVFLNCPKTKSVLLGQTAYRTRCNHIIDSIDSDIIKKQPKYELYGEFIAKVGFPITFSIGRFVGNEYVQSTVNGDIVEESKGKATDKEDIRNKLSQLGNTCYSFTELKMDVDNNCFLPVSMVKSLRRNAIEALEDKICKSYKRTVSGVEAYPAIVQDLCDFSIKKPKILVGVTTISQLIEVSNCSIVTGIFMNQDVLDSAIKDGLISKFKSSHVDIYVELPYIISNRFTIDAYLQYSEINGIYIRNIDGMFAYLDYIKTHPKFGSKLKLICGDGLYAYNNKARDLIKMLIPEVVFELPRELNKRELYNLDRINNMLVVYEHQQVMISAQCLIKNRLGCTKANSVIKIRDDKKNNFYASAICKDCCNVIYNGVPYMILDDISNEFINDIGIESIRLNFTIESNEDTRNILNVLECYVSEDNYDSKLKLSNKSFTSGHFNRGVE